MKNLKRQQAPEGETLPPQAYQSGVVEIPVHFTEIDAPRHGRSEIRLVSQTPLDEADLLAAEELLDALCDSQVAFTNRIDKLTTSILVTRSAHLRRGEGDDAHLRWLEERVQDLVLVRDAMALLQLSAVKRSLHPLFLPDSPLAEYLRGIYAWTQAIARALQQVMAAALDGTLDAHEWVSFRWRAEEAKHFHLSSLAEDIFDELDVLATKTQNRAPTEELLSALDTLINKACNLEVNIETV